MHLNFILFLLAAIAQMTGVVAQQCVIPSSPGQRGSGVGALTAQETVPMVPYIASRFGWYEFTLDENTGDIDLSIFATGLSGNVTGVTMNCDATNTSYGCIKGAICPPCLDIMAIAKEQDSEGFPMRISVTVKKEIAAQLQSGSAYFQVTTDAYPTGEIRGYGASYSIQSLTGCSNWASIVISQTSVDNATCESMCTADPECTTYSAGASCYNFRAGCATQFDASFDTFTKISSYATSTTPSWTAMADGQALVKMYTSGNASSIIAVHNIWANDTTFSFGYNTSRFNMTTLQNVTYSANSTAANASGPLWSTTTTLSTEFMMHMMKYAVFVKIESQLANRAIYANLMPADISPVQLEGLANTQFDAAVYPSNKRGYDAGKVTVSVNFPTANVGNEIWVTLDEDFSFNSGGATSIAYLVGIPQPDVLVVSEEEHQVQLRWNTTSVPFMYDTQLVTFTLTNMALPNSCEEQEYKIETKTCMVEDFLGAGVLMYRKCVPSMTDLEMEAKPDAGVPKGCRKDGCDACKFLYTSPVDNGMVYSCQHQGQTFYRVNVTMCQPCAYAAVYEM